MATTLTTFDNHSINPEEISQYYIAFMTAFNADVCKLTELVILTKETIPKEKEATLACLEETPEYRLFTQRYGYHAYNALVQHWQKLATTQAIGSQPLDVSVDLINCLLKHHFYSPASGLRKTLAKQYPVINVLMEQYQNLAITEHIALTDSLYDAFDHQLSEKTKQQYLSYYPDVGDYYEYTIPSIAKNDFIRIADAVSLLCKDKHKLQMQAMLNDYLHYLGRVTIKSPLHEIKAYNAAQKAMAILQNKPSYSGFLIASHYNSHTPRITWVCAIDCCCVSKADHTLNKDWLNILNTHLEDSKSDLINGRTTLSFLINKLINQVKNVLKGTKDAPAYIVPISQNLLGSFYHPTHYTAASNTLECNNTGIGSSIH